MQRMSGIRIALAAAGIAALDPAPLAAKAPPVYLAEIPLVCTYSNGNSWMGWAGRWTDWPLTIDRSLPFLPGSTYQVTAPDFLRTLREIRLTGLDGCTFNVQNENLDRIIAAAVASGKALPALTVPDLSPRYIFKDRDWYGAALTNSNGVMFGDRRLVTCYWSYKNSPAELAAKVKELEKTCGPIVFMPDFSLFTNYRWRQKLKAGTLTEADRETAKERLRAALRYAGGARFGFYTGVTDLVDGERCFDADFFRSQVSPLIREVYAEPAFAGKLLGIDVGMGHHNAYMGSLRCSSNGTRTLRDSLACALELKPEVITFFEWDEWNENSGIRPSLWNSFAPRRIIRAMRAAQEGRVEAPLAGDDVSIPNLILSFRKTLALGEVFTAEILSVPEAGAEGTAAVRLRLFSERGELLRQFEPVELDLAKLEERRLRWDTALAGDAAALIPELEVKLRGKTRVWRTGLPFAELRPTANWDRKWVLMPLRDLLSGASCKLETVAASDDLAKVRITADAPREIDRLELTDGGDIVYSLSGDPNGEFREDDGHAVFSAMQFCFNYTSGGAKLALAGVHDAEWLQCTRRTRGLVCPLVPRAEFTADTFFRLAKAEATSAVLRLEWPEIGNFEIPLKQVMENGRFAVVGTNGLCFSVHRYYRQPAFFAPVAAKRASAQVTVSPDLPVSVLGAHAITAEGKICRSAPLVVGTRSGELVPIRVWSEYQQCAVEVLVDRARIPDLRFDLSGKRTGAIVPSGFGRAHDGILGGSTAAATCRNRGDNSRQHCGTEVRANAPSRSPTVLDEGEGATLVFDGSGSYFVMPGGTIPTTAAYHFAFDFRPEELNREQEIFGCGTGAEWGVIGYLRLRSDGRLAGRVLSAYDCRETPLVSPNRARLGEWNRLELISDVDTAELRLNGQSTGKVKIVQPGRFDANAWFGGRTGLLYRGQLRNVRIRHF